MSGKNTHRPALGAAVYAVCFVLFNDATTAIAQSSELKTYIPDAQGFSSSSFALIALFMAILVFFWALIAVRKLTRDELRSRRKANMLEARLNEAEIILNAEPGYLFFWRGRDGSPDHMSGDMRGMVKMPETMEEVLDFGSWMEGESKNSLTSAIEELRSVGKAFNIGIKTTGGELLEVDGRTAGGLATMRFKPLVGERRHNTELVHEVRKLSKQVQRLSAILDSAPLPVWLKDEDGKIVWVNDNYIRAVEGTSVEDVLQRTTMLVTDEQMQPVGEDEKVPDGMIGRAQIVYGGVKHSLDLYEIKTGSDIVCFAIDMTELSETQKELALHIKAHASILDKLATAITIFGPDQRLRFYNSAYAQLWDLDTDWLDSKPSDGEIIDRLRLERKLPEQANFKNWKSEYLSAYKTIEPREEWWHLPDGRSLRIVAEQHPFGGVTYLNENVTEKLSLESKYNALIDVQRETLDNLEEAIALYGADGKLQLYNQAFARFWKLNREFLDRHPHVDEVIERCSELLHSKAIWDDLKYCVTSLSESRNRMHDRLTRTDAKIFDFASVPLPDGNTLITYVDVSASAGIEKALRERNEALESADRLKTNFLSNVSYELRTPLTNILGFAETLTLGIAGELEGRQLEYIDHIQKSSNDLLGIINAILDLTTIDAGAMDLVLVEIDVVQLLQEIANQWANKLREMKLKLKVEIAEEVDVFTADIHRISQVLNNLISNAIGFSPAGSAVQLGARIEGEEIVFWVSDKGRGISEEFQKHAFERFQSEPISGGHRGPGLGLAIVKGFVELHGGSVSLHSRQKQGTTIICRLPITGPDQIKLSERPETSAALAG